MATITQLIPNVSDQFSIHALGYIYNVTGLTVLDVAPDGKTVLNITIPTGYKYAANFQFSNDSGFTSTISPDSAPIAGTTGVMEVTFTSANLIQAADTLYYMSFDVEKV
jgi:hypothetical protein